MNMGKHDFCCAPGCSNSRKTRGDLQFYRIPKEINRRRIWLTRIRRKNFSPTENTRLCSAHFLEGQKSDDTDSVSYNPSIFKHSHVKPKLARSTKNSLATTRVSNALPRVRRKSRKPVRRVLRDCVLTRERSILHSQCEIIGPIHSERFSFSFFSMWKL